MLHITTLITSGSTIQLNQEGFLKHPEKENDSNALRGEKLPDRQDLTSYA